MLRKKLEKTHGELKVWSKPAGSLVQVSGPSGEKSGSTPYTRWFPFGEYTVSVSLDVPGDVRLPTSTATNRGVWELDGNGTAVQGKLVYDLRRYEGERDLLDRLRDNWGAVTVLGAISIAGVAFYLHRFRYR